MLEKSGYSEKAIKYYEDRINVGTIGNADVILDYTGPCGDTIKLSLEVDAKLRKHYLLKQKQPMKERNILRKLLGTRLMTKQKSCQQSMR